MTAGRPPGSLPNPAAPTARAGTATLAIGAVGVVYGDIGTSPLYALREALHFAARDGLSRSEILGVVSLLLWALILIVTLKYVVFLLTANNRGEGGILSLLALVQSHKGRRTAFMLILGVAGAGLFIGDAMITPAISVLSAVEGLKVITPVFGPYVLPVAVALLIALFLVQRYGTGKIAGWFGPVMALWFLVIGAIGTVQVFQAPGILEAIDPRRGLRYFREHGWAGLLVFGAVFLAVTGAEALYADLGHFGQRPIRLAWFALVFPGLALNYLGQGALVTSRPEAVENPFYLLVPAWTLPPLVVLATAATLIASQAVITGAYSLARQSIQLGLLPRLRIVHTSEALAGQIYMPLVNGFLMAGVLLLVLVFETSSALASAYGIAVSGTMLITTILAVLYLREVRHWPWVLALGAIGPIAMVEFGFVVANLLKFLEGGFVPVALAAVVAIAMLTWLRGTALLMQRARKQAVPLEDFVRSIDSGRIATAPGTGIFLTSDPTYVPPALLHNLKHNHVLHGQVIVLTVVNVDSPRAEDDDRLTLERIGSRFTRVRIRFGYMETPNLTRALGLAKRRGLRFDVMTTTFFLSRRNLIADGRHGLPLWQDRIYIGLAAIAADPSDFYHLPRDRVVEIGSQVSL